MQNHMNLHVSAPYEPKISSTHLQHELAKKALANVPGGKEAVARHFQMHYIQSELKPPRPKNLVYHSGYGTV